MDNTQSLNTKDKIKALSIFISEIENSNSLELDSQQKINNLKRICFLIDQYINESIDFAKTTPLKSERIDMLISETIILKKIQFECEENLISLNSKRNILDENEIKVAFDFELDKKREIVFIDGADEIEKRIRVGINKSLTPILKNEYPTIFKDENAYAIFLELHKIYRDKKTHLAYYSFIHISMQKDNLIICNGTEFIKFLSEEKDIAIDKIDSRQNGKENKKYMLYNNIKLRFSKDN